LAAFASGQSIHGIGKPSGSSDPVNGLGRKSNQTAFRQRLDCFINNLSSSRDFLPCNDFRHSKSAFALVRESGSILGKKYFSLLNESSCAKQYVHSTARFDLPTSGV
jgi:hypothetical protein